MIIWEKIVEEKMGKEEGMEDGGIPILTKLYYGK